MCVCLRPRRRLCRLDIGAKSSSRRQQQRVAVSRRSDSERQLPGMVETFISLIVGFHLFALGCRRVDKTFFFHKTISDKIPTTSSRRVRHKSLGGWTALSSIRSTGFRCNLGFFAVKLKLLSHTSLIQSGTCSSLICNQVGGVSM